MRRNTELIVLMVSILLFICTLAMIAGLNARVAEANASRAVCVGGFYAVYSHRAYTVWSDGTIKNIDPKKVVGMPKWNQGM